MRGRTPETKVKFDEVWITAGWRTTFPSKPHRLESVISKEKDSSRRLNESVVMGNRDGERDETGSRL